MRSEDHALCSGYGGNLDTSLRLLWRYHALKRSADAAVGRPVREKARAVSCPASTAAQQSMTAAEAVSAAAAEGLALVRRDSASGFRNVTCQKRSNRYLALLNHNGVTNYLGSVHPPEEAALRVAR